MIDLKALAEQIAAQNNRATQYPMFIVFEKDEIVSREGWHDFISWFEKEEGAKADDSTTENLNFLYHEYGNEWFNQDEITIEDEDEDDRTTWQRLAIKEVDKFVTIFFTEQAAKDYIEANKHNLNKPFIWGHSLYRNAEMIGLREYILSHREQAK